MVTAANAFKWHRSFAWIVTILCLLAAITFVSEPIDREYVQTQSAPAKSGAATDGTKPAPATQAKTFGDTERMSFKVFLLLATGTAAAWFAFAYTGDPVLRHDEQVKFAYFFVIASFAILTIPPFVKSSQAIGNEPIGIISGCVELTEIVHLRCKSATQSLINQAAGNSQENPGRAVTPVRPVSTEGVRNQWLVNIGGALEPQVPGKCPDNKTGCKIGSPENRANVTGGVVVPLPFVIIALFDGAISLSRRVPEIQKRSDIKYVGTETEPALEMHQARECFAFQILQFISAPLIAITAYMVLGPECEASAVGLAFLAGFASETILLMIRGVANGVQPKSTKPPANGTGTGAAADPDLARSAGSGKAGSGAASSGTAGAGTSSSGTAAPGTAGSGTAGSGTAGSGTARSGTAAPRPAGSGPVRSDVAGSAATGSGMTGSGASGPDVPRPDVASPDLARPDVASPDVTISGVPNSGLASSGTPAVKVNSAGSLGKPASVNSTADDQSTASVNIRLCIDVDLLDRESLQFTVDGTPDAVTAEGMAELSLASGRHHILAATGQRHGQPVRGALALTVTVDDDGSLFELKLV